MSRVEFTPELIQLLEHGVRLSRVQTSDSHQKVGFVSEHRLNFSVGQSSQILWIDERVTAAVQTHLTVHLTNTHRPLVLISG